MAWLFLSFAIVMEVIATSSLKLSDGFSKLVPSIVVGLCYAASFYCLSRSLAAGMPLAVAYAVWSGVGLALVALISHFVFSENLGWLGLGGLVLIGAGVIVLELSTHTAATS